MIDCNILEDIKKNKICLDLLNFMPEVIFIMNEDRKLLWVNEYGIKKFEYDNLDEMIGKNINDFLHPDFIKRMNYRAKRVFSGQIPERERVVLKKKDGSTFVGLVHSKRICDDSGTTIGAIGCVSDITKYIELEHAVKKRKELKNLKVLAGNFNG